MNHHKKSFRHDSLQDAQSILKILTAITDGLAQGSLSLRDNNDEILLNPQGLLQLKLAAMQEANHSSLSLKISWHNEMENAEHKNSLHIS